MPWRDFAKDWIGALSGSYRASFLGAEKSNGMAVFALQEGVPEEAEVRLTFPCGHRLTGRPVWQRPPASEEKAMLAFYAHELGLSHDELSQLEQAAGTRRNPRSPVRLWGRFPHLLSHGTVTRDLSLGGCRLEGTHEDLVGETVTFRMDLPGTLNPVDLQAEVVWSQDNQTGLKFVNLSVCHEALVLRALGEAVAPGSAFLPNHPGENSSCYAVEKDGEFTSLFLSVTNWDFHFKFEHATVKGNSAGCFERFFALESSSEIRALRNRLKVDLKRGKSLVHLYLVDAQDNVLLEIVGEEVTFERTPRAHLVREISQAS